jgi:hypothetical protein
MNTIRDVHFTLQFEGDGVIILLDHGTGLSITNGAELVIAELALWLGDDLARYRVIYRDTMQTWDGLAHQHGRFTRYVPLQTNDRRAAIDFANDGHDCNGNPWGEMPYVPT